MPDESTVFERICSLVVKFKVKELQAVLRYTGLPITGKKDMLLDRIFSYAAAKVQQREWALLNSVHQICRSVNNGDLSSLTGAATYTQQVNNMLSIERARSRTNARPVAAPRPRTNGTSTAHSNSVNGSTKGTKQALAPSQVSKITSHLSFKQSPFYTLVKPLHHPIYFLRPYARERLHKTITYRFEPIELSQDPSLRVYVLSQTFRADTMGLCLPLYFPHNCEIYSNGVSITANTRGVKGRLGSARPVDITERVKSNSLSHMKNLHQLTIAMHVYLQDTSRDDDTASKDFGICTYVVRNHPVEKILESIKSRPYFPKEVVQDWIKSYYSDDSDLQTTEAVYSLIDKTMMCKIQCPVRSRACEHVDCFDGLAYLQLQEQAETWRCPCCDKDITFDSLVVDEYFTEVLQKATSNASQIVVGKDGSWKFKEDDPSDDETDTDDEMPPQHPLKRLKRAQEVEIIDLTTSDDEELESASQAGTSQPQQNAPSNTVEPSRPPVQIPQTGMEVHSNNTNSHLRRSVSSVPPTEALMGMPPFSVPASLQRTSFPSISRLLAQLSNQAESPRIENVVPGSNINGISGAQGAIALDGSNMQMNASIGGPVLAPMGRLGRIQSELPQVGVLNGPPQKTLQNRELIENGGENDTPGRQFSASEGTAFRNSPGSQQRIGVSQPQTHSVGDISRQNSLPVAAPPNLLDDMEHFRMTFGKANSALFGILSGAPNSQEPVDVNVTPPTAAVIEKDPADVSSTASVSITPSSPNLTLNPVSIPDSQPAPTPVPAPVPTPVPIPAPIPETLQEPVRQRMPVPPPDFTGEVIDLTQDED